MIAHERIASLENEVKHVGTALNSNTEALTDLKETVLEERTARKTRSKLCGTIIAGISGVIGYFVK